MAKWWQLTSNEIRGEFGREKQGRAVPPAVLEQGGARVGGQIGGLGHMRHNFRPAFADLGLAFGEAILHACAPTIVRRGPVEIGGPLEASGTGKG